jgi:hypothetical protein
VLHSPSWSSTMKVKAVQSPAMLGDAHTMIQRYVPKDCVFVTMTNQLFNALWGSNLTLRIIQNARVYSVVKIQR